jgi:microcystin-dependent protein
MSTPFVGETRTFAFGFAPEGWMACEGQLLPISENETLFQLIGTTYGGDGESTFALPNLQSRVPIHMGTESGITYQLAETGGVEQVTLSVQQIPNHTHAFTGSDANGSQANPAANILATPTTTTPYAEDFVAGSFAANTITGVGGSQPHENCQPFLVISYIISLFGIFPSPT